MTSNPVTERDDYQAITREMVPGADTCWRWCEEHDRPEIVRSISIWLDGLSPQDAYEEMVGVSKNLEGPSVTTDDEGNWMTGWGLPHPHEIEKVLTTYHQIQKHRAERDEAEFQRLRTERPDLFEKG